MQTIVELATFVKNADKLFNKNERIALIEFIAAYPYSGDEIPGTHGVRKLRFRAKGKGKRGGSRVIYFVFDDDNPIYLISCYGKNEKEDLPPGQKKTMTGFAIAIKAEAKKRRSK